jgi:hypothetical protein
MEYCWLPIIIIDKQAKNQKERLLIMSSDDAFARFVASSIGAAIAETATLPTDVVKTRLQVQSTGPTVRRNIALVLLLNRVCDAPLIGTLHWNG